MEIAAEKAVQDKAKDYDEKAFDMVGPNAPQDVKDAWMDAAKEVNANGMGIRGNGMMGHISQMMVQRLNKQLKGETENFDILGSTVEQYECQRGGKDKAVWRYAFYWYGSRAAL